MSTGREQHLHELHAMGSRDAYFEGIRQIIDQLTDDFPVPRPMWVALSDLRAELSTLEQGYKMYSMMEGEKGLDNTEI